jgi:hypothetical protein
MWSSRPADCPVRPRKIVPDIEEDNILWLDDMSVEGRSVDHFAFVRFPNQTVLVVKEVEA